MKSHGSRRALPSELRTLPPAAGRPALNLAAGVYLLSVLAGVSLLNEGEQGCHHAEDGADRGGGGVDG